MSQDRLVIRGGRALSGHIVPSGNKNAALPILAACLLTDEEVIVENVPDILDVHEMLALLDDLGVTIRDDGPNALALKADRVRTTHLDPDLCRRLRASLLRESCLPPAEYVMARYRARSRWLLPWWYARRALAGARKFSARRHAPPAQESGGDPS